MSRLAAEKLTSVNEKIDLCIEIAKKQRLVDSEFIRQQYAVRKIFYVRTLKIFAKYRRIADFNYCSPFLTARYKKKLKSYSDYFW